MMKRNLVLIALFLLVSGIFAGRLELIASAREEMRVTECMKCQDDVDNECDRQQSRIENDGWMTFGLAVQEMNYEGSASARNERTHESDSGGNNEIGRKIAGEVRKRFSISKLAGKAISAKKIITYYVFGLCKLLD